MSKRTRVRRLDTKALMAGLLAGAAMTTGIAIAQGGGDSGQQPATANEMPAPGQMIEPGMVPDVPADDAAPYAHLGAAAGPAVLDTCRDTTLAGVAASGAGPITDEDVLQCKALIAVADGRLKPGDYTKDELTAAVNEVTK